MDVPTLNELNIAVTVPATGLATWACLVLLLDLFIPQKDKYVTMILSLAGVVAAFVLNLSLFGLPVEDQEAFTGMYIADGFTAFVNLVALVAAFIGILIAYEYMRRTGVERGEYYPLLLISASGTMLMGGGRNLVVLFVALELLSIPLYVMSGLRRGDPRSEESAVKYFLLGAFSSAFLVYGVALVYGAAGTTDVSEIAAAITAQNLADNTLLVVGAGLLLVGLGFKVAVVPFHMWTPDVYQGAPTAVTGYMSVGAKVGGFVGMMRVFLTAFPALNATDAAFWQDAMAVIAALTVILGNVVAIAQRDIKRMLAYSSIAHAGYLLMGVAAAGSADVADAAVNAALFYLLAYTFTNMGAFAVAIAVERDDTSGTNIDDFAGLGYSRPVLALSMALFMFSLTGIPPSAGMVGKFYLFRAAVDAGLNGLALVGLFASLVSAFYYVRVIVKMYMEPGRADDTAQPVWSHLGAAVVLAAIGTLVLGLLPLNPADLTNGVLLALGG
jgi:NADH-quinone oxidoreductase subunit N